MIYALALWLLFGDLGAVKAEPDLEKRSELALTNAEHEVDEARQAYKDGKADQIAGALAEVSDSADICYDSLARASTPARRSKYYKRAEMRTRTLIRRLTSLRDDMSFDVRPQVETVIKKVSDVHDELLADIMSRKK